MDPHLIALISSCHGYYVVMQEQLNVGLLHCFSRNNDPNLKLHVFFDTFVLTVYVPFTDGSCRIYSQRPTASEAVAC